MGMLTTGLGFFAGVHGLSLLTRLVILESGAQAVFVLSLPCVFVSACTPLESGAQVSLPSSRLVVLLLLCRHDTIDFKAVPVSSLPFV